MTAVVAALDKTPPATPAALFKATGMTLVSTVGGASGPLYGTLFLRMAASAGEAGRRSTRPRSAPRCGPGSTGSSPAARPRPATRPCSTRWPRPATPTTRRSPDGAGAGRRAGRRGAGGRRGPGRDDPDAGPQGPGQLPGRTQRRPPGPGGDLDRAADRRGRAGRAAEPAMTGIVVVSHSRALARAAVAWPPRWCTATRCGSRWPPAWTRRRSAPTRSRSWPR